MQELKLENVVKVPTYFKFDSPTCTDLILTSDKKKLANIRAVETGLSDFHAMVVTTLKGSYHKRGPKIITYRDHSKFDNHSFREGWRRVKLKAFNEGRFQHFRFNC